jgi:hypothetical protein
MKKVTNVSLIAPMYNEEEVVEIFFSAIDECLSGANLTYGHF